MGPTRPPDRGVCLLKQTQRECHGKPGRNQGQWRKLLALADGVDRKHHGDHAKQHDSG